MCSLPNEKTRQKWMNEVSWLELNDANLMICKKGYLLAEQNETLMCNTSKFVQGNSNYQKFSFRYHNLSELHHLTCKSKENLDTQVCQFHQEKLFNKFHQRVRQQNQYSK